MNERHDPVVTDRLREESPTEALAAYLRADPAEVVRDEERLLWITEQLEDVPLAPYRTFLELASVVGRGSGRRRAILLLASDDYYAGRLDDAEEGWRRSIEETAPNARDEVWLRANNNLALILSRRGAWFESLVLFGQGHTVALELGRERSAAFAAARRGHTLVEFGDFARAEAEFERARVHAERCPEGAREAALATLYSGLGRLLRRQKNYAAAVEAHDAEIALLDTLPNPSAAVLVTAHTFRIDSISQLHPERRGALIEEMRTLADRFSLPAGWRDTHRRDLLSIELDLAMQQGDLRQAIQTGRHYFDLIVSTLMGATLIRRLQTLAGRFRELECLDDARTALDRAATETLRRLVEVDGHLRSLPQLAEATEEDQLVIREYRERLLIEHADHFERIVELWKKGHPAFDLVVQDDLTRVCAWCGKFRTREEQWIPIADFLPCELTIEVSHTICGSCQRQHFPEGE